MAWVESYMLGLAAFLRHNYSNGKLWVWTGKLGCEWVRWCAVHSHSPQRIIPYLLSDPLIFFCSPIIEPKKVRNSELTSCHVPHFVFGSFLLFHLQTKSWTGHKMYHYYNDILFVDHTDAPVREKPSELNELLAFPAAHCSGRSCYCCLRTDKVAAGAPNHYVLSPLSMLVLLGPLNNVVGITCCVVLQTSSLLNPG